MNRTCGFDISIINSTEKTLTFKDVKFDPQDYEAGPAFPGSVGPFAQATIHVEAFYYRKTVPFSVQVVCDDTPIHLEQDPYNPANVLKARQQGGLTYTLVCLPTGQSYGLQIVVAETKYK